MKKQEKILPVVCSVDDTCNELISLHRYLAHKEPAFLGFSCLDSADEVTAADVAAAVAVVVVAAAVVVAAVVVAVAIDFSAKGDSLKSVDVAADAAAYARDVAVARGSVGQPRPLEDSAW